jgi:hypothetical protein
MPPSTERFLLRCASLILGGAVACDANQEGEQEHMATDYGAVALDWVDLGGTVADATTGAPIPGIQVAAEYEETTTAEDGTWRIVLHDVCTDGCEVTATDVDGEDNGSYAPATAQASPGSGRQGDSGATLYEDLDILIELERLE